MAEGADWLQSHSTGTRALTLVLCLLGAIAVAWLTGEIFYPGSEVAVTACGAALIVTLGLGYKIWAAYALATLSGHLFGGFFVAAMRFLFTRSRRDSTVALESLKQSLQDRDALEILLVRVRARSRVFALIGWLTGTIAGVVVGAFIPVPGLLASLLLFTVIGGAYGIVVARLGYHGLLPPPMEGG